jgi:hypothetical protein
MPNKPKDVKEFFERMAILETDVAALMTFQKWQMGALAAILAAVIGGWMSR